jgi:hypothetical protein
MDDHLFFTVGGVLDSGLQTWTGLATCFTWNVLADQQNSWSSDNHAWQYGMLAIVERVA